MRAYLKLWSLLLLAFFVMWFVSNLKDVSLFGRKIEQISFFMEKPVVAKPDIVKPANLQVNIEELDTVKSLLLVGDSMVEGLCQRLGAYADYNGYNLYTVIWYGSTTKSWSDRDMLPAYIKKFQPDFIFICIGGNELFVKDIKSKRRQDVRNIVDDTFGIPFLWIGPPNWKDDTGINDLILSEVGSKRFFLSKNLSFRRSADGCHPTWESSYQWMDSIASAMRKSGNFSFKLETPKKKVVKPAETIILTPDD